MNEENEQEETKVCTNCGLLIVKSKYAIHEAYCSRHMVRCTCGELINKRQMEEHKEEAHQPIECKFCKIEFEKYEIGEHELNCTQKPKQCEYCEQVVNADYFDKHFSMCECKTKKCDKCNKYITNKEWKSHQSIKCEPEPEVIKYEDAKESFHPKGQFDKRNPPEEITKQAFDPGMGRGGRGGRVNRGGTRGSRGRGTRGRGTDRMNTRVLPPSVMGRGIVSSIGTRGSKPGATRGIGRKAPNPRESKPSEEEEMIRRVMEEDMYADEDAKLAAKLQEEEYGGRKSKYQAVKDRNMGIVDPDMGMDMEGDPARTPIKYTTERLIGGSTPQRNDVDVYNTELDEMDMGRNIREYSQYPPLPGVGPSSIPPGHMTTYSRIEEPPRREQELPSDISVEDQILQKVISDSMQNSTKSDSIDQSEEQPGSAPTINPMPPAWVNPLPMEDHVGAGAPVHDEAFDAAFEVPMEDQEDPELFAALQASMEGYSKQ